jgi:hypothetical protein
MSKIESTLMTTFAVSTLLKADCGDLYPAGTTFNFDILERPEAQTAKAFMQIGLETVSKINYYKLAQYAPFTVVYVAKGAPNDLVCTDKDGDHFYMPSGLVHMIKLAEKGHVPPAIPGLRPKTTEDYMEQAEEEDAEGMAAARELVEGLIAKLKQAA